MSRSVFSFSLAAVIGSFTFNACAEETKGFYIGAGYGVVKLKSTDDAEISNPKNGSLQLGYSFTENWSIEGEFSSSLTKGSGEVSDSYDMTDVVRSNLTNTDTGERYTYSQATQLISSASLDAYFNADVSVETSALYGVYRTSGPLYAKIKAGAVSIKSEISASVTSSYFFIDSFNTTAVIDSSQLDNAFSAFSISDSERKTEFSAGIGGGCKFGNKFAAELEYTMLNDDLDFYSASVKYFF